MPNQSDPNSNKPVADQTPNQPAVPIASIQPDLPPLPPDFQGSEPNNPAVPQINQSPSEPTSPPPTSAGPPDMPSVISTNAKKKFGGGRIIATILGIFLLVGGVGAGILLTQQPQIFEGKAWIPEQPQGGPYQGDPQEENLPEEGEGGSKVEPAPLPIDLLTDINNCGALGNKCGSGSSCESGACVNLSSLQNDENNCGSVGNKCASGTTCEAGACVNLQTDLNNCGAVGHKCANGYDRCEAGACMPNTSTNCKTGDLSAPVCCTNTSCGGGSFVCEAGNRLECKTGTQHCTIDAESSECQGVNPGEPPDTIPSPTVTPGPSAQCLAVTAYRLLTDLQPMTPAQLSGLKAGDKVNFCVSGGGTNQPFDKAQFKINSTIMPETTTHKPNGPKASGSEVFCQEYTIGISDTAVTVKGRIHNSNSSLGWVGEPL